MAESVFRILPRTPDGALTEFASEQLKSANIQVSFAKVLPASFQDRTSTVLDSFQKMLPKSLIVPEGSPFLVLSTDAVLPAQGIHPMECRCECGYSGACGGGGGGGKSLI
jgi:hypothetical protein